MMQKYKNLLTGKNKYKYKNKNYLLNMAKYNEKLYNNIMEAISN